MKHPRRNESRPPAARTERQEGSIREGIETGTPQIPNRMRRSDGDEAIAKARATPQTPREIPGPASEVGKCQRSLGD